MDFFSEYSVSWLIGLALSLMITGILAGLMAGLLGVGGGIVIVPVRALPSVAWIEKEKRSAIAPARLARHARRRQPVLKM